ncbi:MAG: L-histidine N(alpha)-methyltransferase [bacterium]
MDQRPGAAIESVPDTEEFLNDVIAGLSATPRTLPCKYFYDQEGSRLFDAIGDLDEYYLTRTEIAILEAEIEDLARHVGEGSVLIEYGSGSSRKTRLLLDHLESPAAYVPIDISREHLLDAVVRLRRRYPSLRISPVVADYTAHFALPRDLPDARRVAFFPGSTIGNFAPEEARAFLARIARTVRAGGGLLIGVDLKKDAGTLEAAYDDASGVTAAFNRNVLVRMVHELDAELDPDRFAHAATWNEAEGRVEMHLVSEGRQVVRVGGVDFRFEPGDRIWTESSYKYTADGFARLAAGAGFRVERVWTDPRQRFSVQYLVASPPLR